jgi:putative flippase GtrA
MSRIFSAHAILREIVVRVAKAIAWLVLAVAVTVVTICGHLGAHLWLSTIGGAVVATCCAYWALEAVCEDWSAGKRGDT